MFNFTPLLGAQSSSNASQSLLEFEGGIKVLVDVGWDENFDVEKLRELERHVPTISIILLTHATPSHIAAFAHCCKHFPLFTQIPIYATLPVISLGRTLLQDIYSSTPLASTVIPHSALGDSSGVLAPTGPNESDKPQLLLQAPTSEEIATYFSLINPLKYSQPHQPLPCPFSPPLNGLTITAYNAGHTLGGTIWHIQHGMESVVYAVDWNQVRENALSGAAWLEGSGAGGAKVIEQLLKPTALICSTKGVERPIQAGGRLKRDELLLDMIRNALTKGGTVLIPTDTSARVLELSYLLEQAWRRESRTPGDNVFKQSKVYLTSKNVGATMRYARSMLEWMDENVIRAFESEATLDEKNTKHKQTDSKRNNKDDTKGEDKRGGPFDFKFVKLVERKYQVEKILSNKGPQVILASDTSLAWGFSKDILRRIADEPSNLIILTEEYNSPVTGASSLGQTLWQWYQERRDGIAVDVGSGGQDLEQVHSGGRDLVIKEATRTPLEGKELVLYQNFLATQRQLQNVHATVSANLEASNDAVDDASSSSSSSDESDDERQGKALNYSTTMAQANKSKVGADKEVVGVNALLRQPGVYDYDVRGKKGREAIFPYATKRRRNDMFGELIRPEDYLRAEERDEVNGTDMRPSSSGKDNALGTKRKWGESAKPVNGVSQNGAGQKRHRPGQISSPLGVDRPEDDLLGSDDDDEPDESTTAAVPSKISYTTTTVLANLRIAHVDFSGLHDSRSLSNLIPLIQPRKIVLVGGTPSETKWLANECRQKLHPHSSTEGVTDSSGGDIFTPLEGETVTASMDTNAWTVKLSEALVRKFHWQNVRGLGVVTLMGALKATVPVEKVEEKEETRERKRQKLAASTSASGDVTDIAVGTTQPALPPTLDLLPPNMTSATRSVAQPLHVGDLRLADLRKILQTTGHAAEFRGEGTLVVDGVVAVRKSAAGRIDIEGGAGVIGKVGGNPGGVEERAAGMMAFDAVRRRVYEGLAVIGAGVG